MVESDARAGLFRHPKADSRNHGFCEIRVEAITLKDGTMALPRIDSTVVCAADHPSDPPAHRLNARAHARAHAGSTYASVWRGRHMNEVMLTVIRSIAPNEARSQSRETAQRGELVAVLNLEHG